MSTAFRFAGPVSIPQDTAPSSAVPRSYVDQQDKNFLPIANGTHFNGNFGNASTSLITGTRTRSSRKLLRCIASGASEIQVEWANIYTTTVAPSTDASCEIAAPNSVTVRMAIEYPAGTIRQVSGSSAYSAATAYALFDQVTSGGSAWVCIQAGTGQTPADGSAYWRRVRRYVVNWVGQTDTSGTVVFAPGDYKKSLPIPLTEPTVIGDGIAVLGAFDSGSSANYIPYAGANGAANHGAFVDWVVDSASAMPAVGSALPDTGIVAQTNGNTTASNAADNMTWMKIPYATAITGNLPVRRCVAVFGDSIVQGYGGDIRDGEPCGIFPRALDGVSWWRIAQGGNRAVNYMIGNAPWQMSCVARCSSVIANNGLNDIMLGQTAAQLKANITRMWRALAATGTPVYAGILTPISASSDGWATTANQSRFTTGGASAFPADDASYLTSVYGQTALWLSQDGAQITTPDGQTSKAGQPNHPLDGILDWRMYMADVVTSWKWIPSFTTDGAHPVSACVTGTSDLLVPQLENVIMGRQQPNMRFPGWSPVGEAGETAQSMRRTDINASSTAAANTVYGFIGVSQGRRYSSVRIWTITAGTHFYSILAGLDPSKFKVIDSGSAAAAANALFTIVFATPQYIPAGYGVAIAMTAPTASNRSYGGRSNLAAGLHTTGSNICMAGTSADVNAALTGPVNLNSKFTASTFRIWGELV